VLHRKEMLVDPLYESYKIFCELSAQEEQFGLLSRMDIGTKQGWLSLLAEHKLTIRGHQISKLDDRSPVRSAVLGA
jgi:hypothetical protein